ncbi:hypothetical protein CHS0354_042993 [Potamilus streckersoni]|uniref:Uncharacterized protein n=1 Tax=Potamilus streckersoni TaxID=2493646 RepID=A0AAE0T4K1_9BIVA|nr:hypothetical protein CHS0354_042993 [Potamilus streckersoni]
MLYQNDDLGHCVSFSFATAEKDDSDHSAPVKFVVTGVIGGILVIVLFIGIIVCLLRRGRVPQSIQMKKNEFYASSKEIKTMSATNHVYWSDMKFPDQISEVGIFPAD